MFLSARRQRLRGEKKMGKWFVPVIVTAFVVLAGLYGSAALGGCAVVALLGAMARNALREATEAKRESLDRARIEEVAAESKKLSEKIEQLTVSTARLAMRMNTVGAVVGVGDE
jgi:hypothetical protein